MKTNKKYGTGGGVLEPVMSPEELYDLLMQEIEPDLALGRINTLDEIYKEETSEEREDRLAHYEFAFIIFDECLQDIALENEEDLKMFKDAMRAIAEEAEGREDSEHIKNIERSLSDSL